MRPIAEINSAERMIPATARLSEVSSAERATPLIVRLNEQPH